MSADLRVLVKASVLSGLLLLAFVSLHMGWWGSFSEEDLLRDLFHDHPVAAWPVFLAAGLAYTALGGPRQALAFSSGYLVGGFRGGLLSTLLTGVGAWVTMVTVRQLGQEAVRRRHQARIDALRQLLARDAGLWMCALRLLPVGNNLATNIAAGLSGLPLRPLLLGSLAGYLPQMLLFSYAGAGLALRDHSQLWISLGLLVVSSGLGLYLYHHGLRQRLAERRNNPLAP